MTGPGPLATAADLANFPDASVHDDVLAAAGSAVRDECGWHIAPVVTGDEVLVSGRGGPRLVLPSLRITAVASVTVVDSGEALSGWRDGGAGMLIRDAGWPRGEHNLLVNLDHGFDACPPALIAVVADRARSLASPVPAGTRSVARTVGGVTTNIGYSETAPAWSLAARSVIDRYRV